MRRRAPLIAAAAAAQLALLGYLVVPHGEPGGATLSAAAATPPATAPRATVDPAAVPRSAAPASGPATQAAASPRQPAPARVETQATRPPRHPAVDRLRGEVAAALRGSTARARGVHVHVAGIGDVVDVNGAAPITPASTEKVYVGLSALLAGPSRRLVTEVRATAPPARGVLTGDLVLVAGGDPSLTTGDLSAMARQVHAHGVRVVRGALTVDVSRWSAERRRPGWKPEFVPGEIGPLSAFILERNAWRSDAAYLADPVFANLARFRTELQRAGVRVEQKSDYGLGSSAPVVVARHASAPVSALVRHTLQQSDNLYAEALLADLGALRGVGSARNGLAVIAADAARLRAPLGTMHDGSGLSRDDRQTAAGEVQWLRAAATTPVAKTFRGAMAITCREGTLKRRLCGTPAAGRVWAKTGSLDHVSTLTGYVLTRRGRMATFSILLADASSTAAARQAQDRIMLAIEAFAA